MTDQRNLILAVILSIAIILGFQVFYEQPRQREAQLQQTQQQAQKAQDAGGTDAPAVTAPASPGEVAVGVPSAAAPGGVEATAAGRRIPIDNGRVHGSIATVGSRIDDVKLVDYRETIDPASPEIVLLSPAAGIAGAFFAEQGWVPAGGDVAVPGLTTVWELTSGETLTPDSPVELRWDNGQGQVFERRVEVDRDFMLTVTQRVTNNGTASIALHPYGLISRWGTPATLGFFILHEGAVGVMGGTLHDSGYGDLKDAPFTTTTTGGWFGFTDKYWLVTVAPDQSQPVQVKWHDTPTASGLDRYQTDFLAPAATVAPGASFASTQRVFAGAKELEKLAAYRDLHSLPLFDYAVDFGWFWFLTKPIFWTLEYFYAAIGNYGVAIMLLTLLAKLLFFPLANKSYEAMSRMKLLAPKMMELRERLGDNKAKLNQEMMALYKREKVNPVAGCLPILVQIPVFFALYKVLFVNIEMRHAPFFGWIQDLSAPDPTSFANLFGLLPFDPPAFLHIGVWPLLMGVTMYLQTKLNPAPPDPMQARVMQLLPLIFVFLFATFPAGLVVYWTWNNLLSITQQWYIMRRAGAFKQ